jgi:uncharacterized protein YqeY
MKVFNSVQDILNEKNKYRGNKVIYDMLCVLVGEIDRLPNRSKSTADEIYTCVNRMYNNAKEMSQYKEESKIELEYLQDYIKKQLTDAELVEIIMQYKEDGLKNIGDYMRALNAEYKGRFDGKKVSQLINQLK